MIQYNSNYEAIRSPIRVTSWCNVIWGGRDDVASSGIITETPIMVLFSFQGYMCDKMSLIAVIVSCGNPEPFVSTRSDSRHRG